MIAYWALKDYILLNHDSLAEELEGLTSAFIIGCVSENNEILAECANAISFLITHSPVYREDEAEGRAEGIIDALMVLTKRESKFIRTRAFSTLSTLSTYASANSAILDRIFADMKMEPNMKSREYIEFITTRLQEKKAQFEKRFYNNHAEEKWAGLFCLLRVAKEPHVQHLKDASKVLFHFVKEEEEAHRNQLNEKYFLDLLEALKHSRDESILSYIIKTIHRYNRATSPHQSKVINPDSILWLLNIVVKFNRNKHLCLEAAQTLLEIVSEH